mgnify:CR=1 FL=1
MNRQHLLSAIFSLVLALVLTAGCGAGGADAGYNGGNNVGTSGAQDIGLFRKILDEGGIPGPSSLDANGFFSEHYTQLPPPDCDGPICLQAMLAVTRDWVWDDYGAALQLAFNTTIDASDLEAKPLDLIVVVDTSGSMASEEKLSYAKQGMHMLIDGMDPEDRMALVSYDTEARILSELHLVEDATSLHDAVEWLVPSGATNLHDGLETGMVIASEAASVEREVRVILLSDGNPTTGITSADAIQEMADGFIADGIGLTTIGMGTDFNIDLMKSLAERGAGNFYFLEDPTAIEEVFGQELDYFVTPIAKEVHLEVRSGLGYKLGRVSGTRFWETKNYGGVLSIPTLFLASRLSNEAPDNARRGGGSTFFIDLHPDQVQTDGDKMVTEITLTYRVPGTNELKEQTVVVEYPGVPGEVPEGGYYSNQAMVKNNAVYNIYKGLREASETAETSHNHALWVLTRLEEIARDWNEHYEDDDIAADIELIEQFQNNLRAKGASPVDPDGYDYYGGEEGQDITMGCSTTRRTGAPMPLFLGLMILAALALPLLRRRLASRR